MNIFIAKLVRTSKATDSKEFKEIEATHAPYYQKLIEEHKFIASGPVINDIGEFGGGVFLLRAESKQEAENIMKNDPLVVGGYSEYSIQEFRPLLIAPEFKDLLV